MENVRNRIALVVVGTALALLSSSVAGSPQAVAAARADTGSDTGSVPVSEGTPVTGTPAAPDNQVVPLPDTLSTLPNGSASADPSGSWSGLSGIPVQVRDTNQVTVPPVATGDPATTVAVPQTLDESAPPVDVSVHPTGDGVSPALVLDMNNASVVSDGPQPSPSAPSPSVTSTPSPSASATSAPTDGSTASSTPSDTAGPTASDSPTADPSAGPTTPADPATAGGDAVQVKLSYAKFRYVYAGDWGSRLQVMAFPSCFETTPDDPACNQGVVVPSTNDPASQTVTFTTANLAVPTDGLAPGTGDAASDPSATPDPAATSSPAATASNARAAGGAGGGSRVESAVFAPAATSTSGTTYVVSASASSSDSGDYSAMPVSPTGTWQVGQGSGDFSYSVPFTMPAPAVGGGTPSLGLDYSSQTLDGMTNAANGQGSMAGIGWSVDPGEITRTYTPCSKDGGTYDLCWKTGSDGKLIQDLMITLNGRSSRLVQIGTGNTYRLQDDPGWAVTLVSTTSPTASTPDNPDNNNEAFEVQSPDGTQYWFGWGHGLASTSVVPVYGNNSGEPCYSSTAANAHCQQAWMWRLDKVVDRHHNVTEYTYSQETNYYSRGGLTTNHQSYDRGSYLTSIQYGLSRSGSSGAYSDVEVLAVGRCVQRAVDNPVGCPADPRSDPADWPDVPTDQICNATDTCLNGMPTFFSTMRYESVNTYRGNGGSLHWVDTYRLKFGFPIPDGGTSSSVRDLWLAQVFHTGHSANGDVIEAPIDFDGTFLRNRVVPGPNGATFQKRRLTSIRNSSGGRVDVVYGHAPSETCDSTYVTNRARYASNEECYPAQWNGNWEWWHKYVVLRVAVGDDALGYGLNNVNTDPKALGRLRVYDYGYLSNPGWRYQTRPSEPAADQTWDDWRGYSAVDVHTRAITNGVPGGDLSSVRYYLFRGLNGTKLNDSDSTWSRTSTVTTAMGSYTDSEWLGGQVAEQALRDPAGTTVSRTDNVYGSYLTATATNSAKFSAEYVYQAAQYSLPRLNAPIETTTYTVDAGGTTHQGIMLGVVLNATDDRGTSGTTSDDLATCNWYGSNPSIYLRVLMISMTKVQCRDADSAALSRHENWYDGASATNQLPGVGDVTTSVDNTTASTSVLVGHRYDFYGRDTADSVPYYNGQNDASVKWTTTAYNPGGDASALIGSVKTTGPTGLTTTTTLDPYRSAPATVVDANNQTTTISRDGLGRPLWVDKPGNNTAGHSVTYDYLDQSAGPSRVTTTTLRDSDTGVQDTSWAFYDGWGRPIETQIPSYNPGKHIVSSTGYDERGLVRISIPHASVASTSTAPGLIALDPTTVPHYTTTTYDPAQRPLVVADMSDGSENSDTRYTYQATANIVSVTSPSQPAGSALTTTRTDLDAAGRPATVTQYANGSTPDATGTLDDGSASYSYNPSGTLATITTANSTVGTYRYSYDDLGRRLTATDPDVGTTSYTYDAMGNTTSVDDAMPNSASLGLVSTTYDDLGRPTTRTDGPPASGTLVASWTYDDPNVSNGKGRLASTTSHTPTGDFTTKVDAYDVRGNPLSTTASYPGAWSGAQTPVSVTTTATYNQADQVTSTSYPAMLQGRLPALTVTNAYGTDGLLSSITSSDTHALAAFTYDDINRTIDLASGQILPRNQPDNNGLKRSYGWSATDRVASAQAIGDLNGNITTELALNYTYDPLGNPTEVIGTRTDPGANPTPVTAAWCYTYDGISRLTEAKTGLPTYAGGVPSGCSAATTAAQVDPVTGANYDLGYTFARGGLASITNQTETTKIAFDAQHPHAPGLLSRPGTADSTGVPAPGTFAYDPDGRAISWQPASASSPTVLYTYDAEGNLTDSHDLSSGQDISSAYDVDGTRVARQDGNAITAYLGNTQINMAANGDLTATRTFTTPAGTPLAAQSVDTPNGSAHWTWLFSDGQHSVQLSKNADTGVSQHDSYLPYGDLITPADPLPAERGFLDKVRDSNGTIRLDHRSYDPSMDALTSPDPLLDTSDPQNLNAYAYARNNPISFTDPSGLRINNCTAIDLNCTENENPATKGHGGPTSHNVPTGGSSGSPGSDINNPSYLDSGSPNNIGRPPVLVNYGNGTGTIFQLVFAPAGPCNDDACLHSLMDSGQCNVTFGCQQQMSWLMRNGTLRYVEHNVYCQGECIALGGLAFAGVEAASDVFAGIGSGDANIAANSVRTFGQFGAADIRAAAGAADRGGLSRVGRALQKHSDREGSVFGGLSSGNPIARNEQGMRVLDEILEDPGSTTQVLDNVTNIWDSTGRGIRLSNDGTFMGFLEPLP